jgi:hypothetical protein
MYSKELRTLIDQMLSVNPKNRPTIATILEKPFIKKRVAAYISDFIQNFKPENNFDGEGSQVDILKEQAEKLGIFNSIVKEINAYEGDNDKSNPQGNKFMSYLKKKQEEKKKLEDKINELELEKKQIYNNLKQKVKGKVNKVPDKKRQLSKFDISNKRRLNDSDNDNLKIKQPKRPESSIKKSSRKYSEENTVYSDSLDNNDIIKNRKITDKKSKTIRPVSGIVKENLKINEDSIDEDVLETIREEGTDTGLIVEKNKVIELTQEIVKMREHLEKTQNKIVKIESIIEKDGYDNDIASDMSDEDRYGQLKRVDNIYTKEDDGTYRLHEQIKFLRK